MNDVPWAMQLAIRYDKADPASEVEACEAAARAVVTLLDDERSRSGDWAADVNTWRDGRIRKLVRRARGVRWDEVQQLPGVTVTQGKAAVRAFVPMPTQPLPPALNKLQVSGTNLPAGEDSSTTDALVQIAVNPTIEMTTGKVCAQCGHAAQLAYERVTDDVRDRWRADAFRVRVWHPSPEQWVALDAPVSVVDAGYTELDGPTETTRATWPSARRPWWRRLLRR